MRLFRPTSPSAIHARVWPPRRRPVRSRQANGSVSASTCEPEQGHALAAARHPAIGPKRPIPIAERLGPRGFLLRRLSYASRRMKVFTMYESLHDAASPLLDKKPEKQTSVRCPLTSPSQAYGRLPCRRSDWIEDACRPGIPPSRATGSVAPVLQIGDRSKASMKWLVTNSSFGNMLITLLWLSFRYGSYNGAMVVALTEVMPVSVRTSGFALAYSLASAVFVRVRTTT